MRYPIDQDGTVDLSGRKVRVPKTVSPEAQAFLARPPFGELPPEQAEPPPTWEARERVDAGFRMLDKLAQERWPVTVEEMTIGGVRCHRVRPPEIPEAHKGRVLINLHGGAFVLGGGMLSEAIPIAHLAEISVVAVDYRLAPEHPYPAAVDDAFALYSTVVQHHPPEQIGVYGTSAGAYLTGQLMMRIIQAGLPKPGCLGIFTGGGDLGDFGDTDQIFTLQGFWADPMPPLDSPLNSIRAYLNGADPADPLVSPIRGDLSEFPPSLLISGTRDALLSPTAQFHRALRRAGCEADLFVFEAMPHAHWLFPHLPETHEALDIMARFFKKHLV
jgi:acetyl esterase/lipase